MCTKGGDGSGRLQTQVECFLRPSSELWILSLIWTSLFYVTFLVLFQVTGTLINEPVANGQCHYIFILPYARYSYISKFNKCHIQIILKRKWWGFHDLRSLKSTANRRLVTIFSLVKLQWALSSCLYTMYFYFGVFLPLLFHDHAMDLFWGLQSWRYLFNLRRF